MGQYLIAFHKFVDSELIFRGCNARSEESLKEQLKERYPDCIIRKIMVYNPKNSLVEQMNSLKASV